MSNTPLIQNVGLSETESEDNLDMGLTSLSDGEGEGEGEGEAGGEDGLVAGPCPAGFIKVKGICVPIQALG